MQCGAAIFNKTGVKLSNCDCLQGAIKYKLEELILLQKFYDCILFNAQYIG
jgi:hypothetical protein